MSSFGYILSLVMAVVIGMLLHGPVLSIGEAIYVMANGVDEYYYEDGSDGFQSSRYGYRDRNDRYRYR